MPNWTTGPSTTQTPYLVEQQPNVRLTSLLSAGDQVGTKPGGSPWLFVGVPDGIGAFDNGNGTATILVNHEIGNTVGAVRETGFKGSFVSALTVDKTTLAITAAADLGKSLNLWDATANGGTGGYVLANPAGAGIALTGALSRLCSGDMPAVSAYFNAASGKGTTDRIYMAGEESGPEGRPLAFIATGADAGKAYEVPRLGNYSFENLLAAPASGDKTVVIGMDDSTPGQVYVYIGDKQSTGSTLDKAGLTNGALFGIKAVFATEASGGTPLAGSFTLAALGDVTQKTGATLQTDSATAGVTEWLRPEDGAWDTVNPNRFYFQTTNAFNAPSRLWALDFVDVTNPTLGGTFRAVLDGTEGQQMLDNLGVTSSGSFLPPGTVITTEDVGNNARAGKVFAYDPGSDSLTEIAQFDNARFGNETTAAVSPFNQDEESSGVVDVTAIFGNATTQAYLIDAQAHYAFTGTNAAEVVEGGQLMILYVDKPRDGGGGNDLVRGGWTDDVLSGNAGNDTMLGGDGNDALDGSAGTDSLAGGRGNDSYILDSTADIVVENANEGTDEVFASVSLYLAANVEKLSLLTGASFGVGNGLANTVNGNAADNLLIGGAGNDSIFGNAGIDQLFGETGDDSLDGGAGNDALVGGLGDDSYAVGSQGDVIYENPGEGTDTAVATLAAGTAFYLYGNLERLTLAGTAASNGIGNGDANTLTGNGAANWLLGGAGNDTINGGAGFDVLFGEAGADTFVFNRGTGGDVIGGFIAGTDKIDLRGLGFTGFTHVQAASSQVGGDLAIDLAFGDFIVLQAVQLSSLTAGDFILA